MSLVVLLRDPSDDQGTTGTLYVGGQLFCYSIELPDRGNQPNISRIPAGRYRCIWHRSPRYGWVYLVRDVEGRSWILIHPGNWAGDRSRGYISNSNGCLLLGRRKGRLKGQRAVLASKPAVRAFFKRMNKQDFDLLVVNHGTD